LTYEFVSPVLVLGQADFGLFAAHAAQAFACELDAMGIMNEAVQDGVGVSWVSNDVVPGCHGKLGGDDRRSAPIAFFEDFQEIVAGAGVERFEAEVVEDQEIGATKGFEQAWMAPVAAREGQVLTELRPAMINDGAIVAAGLLANGAGEPTFPGPARPDQGQIIAGVDPLTFGELLEQGSVEPARGAIVDVFDARLLTEHGGAQPRRQPFVAPKRGFPIEQ
jgi:hypothetical protein